MQVSYKWLQRYVDITISPEELGEKLTMAGITVDVVRRPWQGIDGLVAGDVLSVEQHPNADRLHVCRVNVGEGEPLQIVCGAPNVAAGQKVIIAMLGAHLPGGKISKGKLRGVESFGMICSLAELNVEDSAEGKAGIYVLPQDTPVGTDIVELFMLDDAILELDLTPNRADCLSIINVAREVAAVTGANFRLPEISYPETTEQIADLAKIAVADALLCPRYTARLVKNVKIGPSPLWMQHFLRTAGMRPINNVVDISNFVLMEYGQPLHTFDYDTLVNHEILVRPAQPGEKMVTLDRQERLLPERAILICDGEKPVCIGGVMGGLNSEVTGDTSNILVEAAAFDRVSIRRTSRQLGLRSEASLRFEKGVDLFNLDAASRRSVQLMVELCGAEAVSGMLDTYTGEAKVTQVMLRPAKVNAILGTAWTEKAMVDAIAKLNFPMIKQSDGYLVDIPSYRQDITGEIDLVEEVARLLGFDHIPVSLPCGAMTQGRRTEEQSFYDNVTNSCAALGLRQVVNYSFISPKDADALMLPEDHPWRQVVSIMNPLNEEQSVMRTSLLPGLLQTATRNNSRRNLDLALFEQGHVFLPQGQELPEEPLYLGALIMGKDCTGWYCGGTEMDFFYLKGIFESLLVRCGVEYWWVEATFAYPFLHPGRGAKIIVGGEEAGFIGEIHPQVAKNYELNGRACVLQLELGKLFAARKKRKDISSLPKFPATTRDIALVAKMDIPASLIEKTIVEGGGKYLTKIELFDVYQGAQVAEGYRSLAYGLTFQAVDRTLTDDEVNGYFKNILSDLGEKLQVQLR